MKFEIEWYFNMLFPSKDVYATKIIQHINHLASHQIHSAQESIFGIDINFNRLKCSVRHIQNTFYTSNALPLMNKLYHW